MKKRLIVNADDYGLTTGCTLAIDEAMQAGAVTSASALVWNREAVRELFPELRGPVRCGVHLRLTDGAPVLGFMNSLVEPDAPVFPRSRAAVEEMKPDPEEVYAEWKAQIELFLDTGGGITHLDTHRHCHALPILQSVYTRLCVEFGVAGVPMGWRQREALRALNVPTVDYTEIRWTNGSAITLERLLLEDFERHETVHLMCHPGYVDDDLKHASGMVKVRDDERRVLQSNQWKSWLKLQGIELISYDDIRLQVQPDPLKQVDLIFLAWNRKEYTDASLRALLQNTDWARVGRLILYDDGSCDGTRELLYRLAMAFPGITHGVGISQIQTELRSPVAIMNHYLTHFRPAPWFAKIDSDVVVPPGWLPECLKVLREHPEVDLLGIEAKCPLPIHPDHPVNRYPVETDHIGGIGLFRSAAFDELPEAHGRMGFSDWQIHHDVKKAWINPALPVILLDRLPIEPWKSLGAQYELKGWQRPWTHYTMEQRALWEWWTK